MGHASTAAALDRLFWLLWLRQWFPIPYSSVQYVWTSPCASRLHSLQTAGSCCRSSPLKLPITADLAANVSTC